MRPHLHGAYIKDLHVKNGVKFDFEHRPLGSGNVEYLTVFRNLKRHRIDALLSASDHFLPPSGSRVEAMQINVSKVKELIRKVEAEAY